RYYLRGPVTLDRCCKRNVVVPGEYSKGFFYVPIGLYLGILRPATALWMPARSALGVPAGVNPAADIKPSIWPLWPSPASTTRGAPGARRQAACGISARWAESPSAPPSSAAGGSYSRTSTAKSAISAERI